VLHHNIAPGPCFKLKGKEARREREKGEGKGKRGRRMVIAHTLHCVQEKNTHSHFLSYLHELFVDLNKNCSEYT